LRHFKPQRTDYSIGANIFLILILGLILEVLFLGANTRTFFFGVAPDFLTLTICWLALRIPTWSGGIAAFLLGFIRDGFSFNYTGIFSLTLLLALFLVKGSLRILEYNRVISQICLVFIIFFLINLVFYPLLVYIFIGTNSIGLLSHHVTSYCTQGLLTAILTPFWFALLDKLAIPKEKS
jgi:rod shape-determining protein MreD